MPAGVTFSSSWQENPGDRYAITRSQGKPRLKADKPGSKYLAAILRRGCASSPDEFKRTIENVSPDSTRKFNET